MSVETALVTLLTADATTAALIGTHGMSDGDAVTLLTSAADLPDPLAIGTTYYVRDAAATTFKLTATVGGGAVDITDAGTGTHRCIPTARPREWFTFTAAASDTCTCTRYRIYPGVAPQGSLVPCLVYNRISAPRFRSLDGPEGYATPRIQLDAWAGSYSEAKALAVAVREAIDGYTGVSGVWEIGDMDCDDEGDALFVSEELDARRRYGVRQDWIVWHVETP